MHSPEATHDPSGGHHRVMASTRRSSAGAVGRRRRGHRPRGTARPLRASASTATPVPTAKQATKAIGLDAPPSSPKAAPVRASATAEPVESAMVNAELLNPRSDSVDSARTSTEKRGYMNPMPNPATAQVVMRKAGGRWNRGVSAATTTPSSPS